MGQKVNTSKSAIFFSSKISRVRQSRLLWLTGFVEGQFPFTYHGASIYLERMARRLFDSLIHKIQTKVTSWKGKLLSQDGWLVLIRHILTSMVTHTLGVLLLPTGVLQKINSIFSTFFSRESNGREKRKWGAWANLCKPIEEGGIRVRDLGDIWLSLHMNFS